MIKKNKKQKRQEFFHMRLLDRVGRLRIYAGPYLYIYYSNPPNTPRIFILYKLTCSLSNNMERRFIAEDYISSWHIYPRLNFVS